MDSNVEGKQRGQQFEIPFFIESALGNRFGHCHQDIVQKGNHSGSLYTATPGDKLRNVSNQYDGASLIYKLITYNMALKA